MALPSLDHLAEEAAKLAVATKILGDPTVPVRLATFEVDTSPSWPIGDRSLTLTAGFTARLEEFNSLDDVDDHGGIAPPPKEEDDPAGGPPPIVLTTESAWLKYGLAGALRLEGGADLGSIGFAFEAGAGVELLDYRRHSRNETIAKAIVSDLSRPRFVFSLDDVLGLAEGEALGLKAAGELKLGLKASWADVLSAGMTSLTALLKPAAPVSVTLNTGLTASVDVSLSGSFSLVFSRDRVGLRVVVRKAAASGVGGKATAGVRAEFTNLDKAATAVLDAVLGAKYQSVVSLLQRADPANLSPAERKLFDEVVERLGLREEVATAVELLERIKGLRGELERKLEEIARSRIELGMTLEYHRTKTNETLVDAYVEDEKALAAAHPDLVRGDVRRLLDDARDGGKYDVREFLHRTTVEAKGSWGFGLSVGNLVKATGVDTSALRKVHEVDAAGRERMTFEALRGYAADFAGDRFSWTVDFVASMSRFVAGPKAADFDYGLHLSWSPTSRPGPDDVDLLLDAATLFGAGSAEPSSRASLLAALGEKPGAFTVSQSFPEAALAEIAERARENDGRKLLSAALAAALPFDGHWPERSVLGLRRTVYAPLFRALLIDPNLGSLGPSAVRGWIGNALLKAGASTAGMEMKGTASVSLFEVLRLHRYFEGVRSLGSWVGGFELGLASLARVLGSQAGGVAPNEIDYVWERTRPFFTQAFLVRAAAHYLFLLASEAGVADLVERSIRLDYAGGTKTLIQ